MTVELDEAGHSQVSLESDRAGDVEAMVVFHVRLCATRVEALAVHRGMSRAGNHEHDLVRGEEQPRVVIHGVPPGIDVRIVERRVESFDETAQSIEFGGGEGDPRRHIGR